MEFDEEMRRESRLRREKEMKIVGFSRDYKRYFLVFGLFAL